MAGSGQADRIPRVLIEALRPRFVGRSPPKPTGTFGVDPEEVHLAAVEDDVSWIRYRPFDVRFGRH